MVNGQDVDGVAAVRQLPAGSAASRVPAGDGLDTSDVWEARNLALGRPVVSGLEAVGAVGAGDDVERAGAVVVAGIIRDGIRRDGGSEEGELEEAGQLHLDYCVE